MAGSQASWPLGYGPARGLIYSATADYRRDSIPTARDALTAQRQSINVQLDATDDNTRFTNAGLASYDRYFDLGGNFVAMHSASDCLRNTTFYAGRLVRAFFDSHPVLQNATVDVVNASHPSTSMFPAQWHVQDEMYNLKSDPRSLGAVSSYSDPGPHQFDQGTPHPISYIRAWYQEHGVGSENGTIAGLSFYTSLGHLNETWQDNLFLAHVAAGISWALKSNTSRAFNSSGQVGNGPAGTDYNRLKHQHEFGLSDSK
ncbi:trehalose utilization-domain-containing protein [Russula aff. rugulosa BPL654]|nr:trehalose utilization-domain-containing protein [Russula aff. rugulosa BPL654]